MENVPVNGKNVITSAIPASIVNNSEIIDNDELIMMNNDFYNDDFYDYKDTFMSNKQKSNGSDGKATNVGRISAKARMATQSRVEEENFDEVDENDNLNRTNNKNHANRHEEFEEYDQADDNGMDDEDDDDLDENNDFKTGPLAIKRQPNGHRKSQDWVSLNKVVSISDNS